ncbi:hypothetical protein F4804DRAFT_348436 [Jackrogersella minutella]|nr:hypothetical protein F4804DRAFT_348436 [Jackrogersella minutella]
MKHKLPASASFEFLDYSPHQPLPSPTNLSVKKDAFWSYCGPLLTSAEDLPPSLHDWTQAVLSTSLLPHLLPLLAFINEFLQTSGLSHYWLTIRATKATRAFDRARWHTDDLFFDGERRACALEAEKPAPQTDWKLCAALLGPATLFVPAAHQASARGASRAARRARRTEHACTSVRCPACAAAADAVREDLRAGLAPLGSVHAAPGQCAFFRIGAARGAVHSEPGMGRGDRVFVNVVPGRREELAGLVARWGMSFPRSWWIASDGLRGRGAA